MGALASSLHFSLEMYQAFLEGRDFPQGPFDPAAPWKSEYDAFALVMNGPGKGAPPTGRLSLERLDSAVAGEFGFRVECDTKLGGGVTHSLRAEIRCAEDDLAAPLDWTIEASASGARGEMPEFRLAERGALKNGQAEIATPGKIRSLPLAARATSDWTLFEALRRAPLDSPPPRAFDMLENLRLPKREQRMHALGETEADCANGRIRLHGLRQTGEGVLPIHYWRDDWGRILLALGGCRAYALRTEKIQAAANGRKDGGR
ncbi:MAG: hypothetical protein BWZ10_02899 [candidate division BRC1 bacterium ADurb.BinA364]|nr:MAG: hypothetical protein BWZ10_02899 [candidate division BRC1 bacterium ADurb.BinA364]